MTDSKSITITVPGVPRPGGSKRGFVNPKTGRVIITDAAGKGNKDWRASVAFAGREAMGDRPPLDEPLLVNFKFILPRPKCHYGSGRNSFTLKPSAPPWPSIAPDTLKLARSTEDALSKIVWRDDCLIVYQTAWKTYGERPGAEIIITPLNGALDKWQRGIDSS